LDNIFVKNVNSIYFKNKQELQQLLTIDDRALSEFLANPNYDSLVYFGENQALQKLYTNYLNKELETDVKYSSESLLDAINNVNLHQYSIVDINHTYVPEQEAALIGKAKGIGTGFIKSKNTEKIGLKGERYVYALLKNKYAQVEWVSENAKQDGVNAQG
jgi:hypothetical protein